MHWSWRVHPGLAHALALYQLHYLFGSLHALGMALAALVVSSVLGRVALARLAQRLFYDAHSIVSAEHIDHSFKQLRLLLRFLELNFKLFDALLRYQWLGIFIYRHSRRCCTNAPAKVCRAFATAPIRLICPECRTCAEPACTSARLFLAARQRPA